VIYEKPLLLPAFSECLVRQCVKLEQPYSDPFPDLSWYHLLTTLKIEHRRFVYLAVDKHVDPQRLTKRASRFESIDPRCI